MSADAFLLPSRGVPTFVVFRKPTLPTNWMMLLRLVTIDVTNTMIRVSGSPGKHYALIASHYGIKADEETLTWAFVKNYKEYCSRYPNFGASCQMPAFKWWSSLVVSCFNTAGIYDNKCLDKVAKDLYYYFSTADAWELVPGTLDALEDLQNFDIQLGVISNYDHRLYKVLTEVDLRRFFDFVLPSYVIGVEKPDPCIFLKALKHANVLASEAVHFGDNVVKDFIGARNAGFHAYLMETKGVNHNFIDNKYVVKSAGEFLQAITPYLRPKLKIL